MLRFAEPHIYTPTDDSLVLWISGRGRGVGSKVFDLSGKGNHGTIYGATWKNTPLGHSVLSFDGVDDYVGVADGESLKGMDELTVEVWAKPLKVGKSGLVSKWGSWTAGTGGSYILWQTSEGYVGWGVITETRYSHLLAYSILEAEKWYYLVGVYDGFQIEIYINAKLKGAKSFIGGRIASTNHPCLLGRYSNVYLNGFIGESRLHNRAFSAEEIRERYNMTKHLYGY